MLILLRVLVTRVPLYSATVVILFEKPKPDLSPRCTERSGYPNMQSLLACPRFNQRTSNYDRPSAPLSTLPSVMTTGWTFYILRCRILSCVLLTHRADIARWFPLTLTQCHPLAMAPGYATPMSAPPHQLSYWGGGGGGYCLLGSSQNKYPYTSIRCVYWYICWT